MARYLWWLLALPAIAWGTVYRWVAPDGTVVYTDKPRPGAEVVELPPLPTYTPPSLPLTEPEAPPQKALQPYTAVAILKPKNDEVIWSDQDILEVQVALEPPLNVEEGHRFQVFLDGRPLPQTWNHSPFQITGVYRGTHTLQVKVIDEKGKVLAASPVVTFHMKHHSILHPRP
ncbi:MAG: DUF4124 domain-containing protein [Gammaproteobacteria bacterium]|nr:MAG: DUF4124 domain-containing protein [Gammaproteobacteria bacterium]